MSEANSESSEDSALNKCLEQVMPLLDSVVRNACRHYKHPASVDEVERLKQRLYLHLLENAKARLDSFQHHSLLRTWLQKVADNYVSRFLQQEHRYTALKDVPLALLTLQSTQEEKFLKKEQLALLAKVIKTLTARERELLKLIGQGLSAKEIARRMRMKEASVYQRKHALIYKLRQLVEEGEKK